MNDIGSEAGTERTLLAVHMGEIEAQLRGLQNASEQVSATVNIAEVFDAVWEEFGAGRYQDYAAVARRHGLTRVRLTQLMRRSARSQLVARRPTAPNSLEASP